MIMLATLIFVPDLFSAHSDYIGTSTGKLMEIEVDPRVNALGGAYCGYVSDVVGYEANIAGISELAEKQIVVAYYDWLMDTSIFYGAFGMPVMKKGVMATSLKFLSIPDFVNKNEWGEDSGTISTGNFVYSLGFAYKWMYFMKFGINAKYNRQSFSLDGSDLSSFSSLVFDLGAQYQIDVIKVSKVPLLHKSPYQIKNLQLGFSIQNLGFTSSTDPLPIKLKFGMAYPVVQNCVVLLDINRNLYTLGSLFDSDYRFNFGVEYNYKSIVYVRGGVKLGYDMNSFTIGAGIQAQFGSFLSLFNYGYNAHDELGHINNLSVSTKFKKISLRKKYPVTQEKLIDYHYYRGIAFFIEGNIENAVMEWKKVLLIDPDHSDSIERIEEAQKMLKQRKEIVPEHKKLEENSVEDPYKGSTQ